MKTILTSLCLTLPLLAFAANDAKVKRFDREAEDFLFAHREHINPTMSELTDLARTQGTLKDKDGKVVPPASAVPLERQPGVIQVAPSYWTLGEAAKAGVDPLNLVKPMASQAAIPEPETKGERWFYAGGFGLFALAAFGIFYFSTRGFSKRES